MNQEQASLLQIPDNFKKMIIVGDKHYSNYNDAGIQQVGIYNFLLNPEIGQMKSDYPTKNKS